MKARKNQKLAFDVYTATIEDNKFFGFDSFHFFWERFGKTTVNFIFCLWVVYVFLFAPKVHDKFTLYCRLAVCVTYLFVQMFTYFWILQKFQDFSQAEYVFTAFAFSFVIVYILYKLLKNKRTKEELLHQNLMKVAKFTFKNTKPEKREEMLDMIKKIAKNN
ncbi:hypothetical protein P8625_14270 [Tenacibaculum tangerinum]|uniref:Uncharacterized protein n=1 Tax=Tenacibaculum tangerinum TaxID=3038772 RepID=A0ABY8L177_9FLAO|nr:hypothetical protein [Tenacibaculum tangerinum]WGH75222.1 hypothetical protein P8625_14270 [Tenacibaculum tangerinum]